VKKLLIFSNIICFSILFTKPVLGALENEITEVPQPVLIAEWAVEVLVLALVGGIIYSIIRAIQVYGGLIGNSLKIVGVGIFFLAIESINRVLERFGLDYLQNTLGTHGKELLFAILKAIALFILAIGFQTLTTVFHKTPKAK